MTTKTFKTHKTFLHQRISQPLDSLQPTAMKSVIATSVAIQQPSSQLGDGLSLNSCFDSFLCFG